MTNESTLSIRGNTNRLFFWSRNLILSLLLLHIAMDQSLDLFPTVSVLTTHGLPYFGHIFAFNTGECDFQPTIEDASESREREITDAELIEMYECPDNRIETHRFRYVIEKFWNHELDEIHCVRDRYRIRYDQERPAAYSWQSVHAWYYSNHMGHYYNLTKRHPNLRFAFGGSYDANQGFDVRHIAISKKIESPVDLRDIKLSQLTRAVAFLMDENRRLRQAIELPQRDDAVEFYERDSQESQDDLMAETGAATTADI